MKKLVLSLITLALPLLPSQASAACVEDLLYAFTAAQAEAICTGISEISFSGPALFANGTGAVPSIAFASDPDTGMYRSSSNVVAWSAGGTQRMSLSTAALNLFLPLNITGDIVGQQTNNIIRASSSDGADDDIMYLASGGAASHTRGGYISAFGNEVGGNGGNLNLIAGAASGADVTVAAPASNGTIPFQTNGFTTRMTLNSTGDLVMDATNGGFIRPKFTTGSALTCSTEGDIYGRGNAHCDGSVGNGSLCICDGSSWVTIVEW